MIEEDLPTKEQTKTLAEANSSGQFVCPNCASSGGQNPQIENPGEDRTQIYCNYGCGYIYLEDFK